MDQKLHRSAESVRPSGILDKVHLPLELVVDEVGIGGWGLLLLCEPRGPEWHEEVLVEDRVSLLVLSWESQSIAAAPTFSMTGNGPMRRSSSFFIGLLEGMFVFSTQTKSPSL